MNNRKIMIVFHDNRIGSGGTRSMMEVFNYLNKQPNIELTALVPRKKGDLHEYLLSQGINTIVAAYGGQVYEHDARHIKKVIKKGKCILKTFASYLTACIVSEKIKNESYDIIYTNTSSIYIGIWIAEKIKINHIWHIREFGLEDQNSAHIFGDKYLERLINSNYNKCTVFISHALKKQYLQRMKICGNSIVAHDDIEEGYYCPIKKNVNSVKNILITGTIAKGKGQLVAIKAIEILNHRGHKVHLKIAGLSIDAYGKEIIEYVRTKNLNNIQFLGFIHNMDVVRSDVQVSIVASTSEAFGRIIIEDMLSGICVVGSNSGSLPELVKPYETGLLFECNNELDLADKLESLILNMGLLNKIRYNAQNYALEFTKHNCAKKLYALMSNME